ncbi:MAG: methylmalonyl Co-A mutase-associated GTPase MeaB [Chloroflexota bacterium]|jgi:LAO/AO transport system kinase
MITETLDEAILTGQTRAVAKAISMVEQGHDESAQLLSRLRPYAQRGHLIGLTGSPGAGKSTLVGELAKEFRARGKTVGVIAIDPSSPYTGGAFLGDRVRMPELASDPGVYVRSMASRGSSGGLASAVEDAALILKAAGKDIVLVETVGVGQGELDVANIAQTVVVVLTPGMGDEIQSLKAGILEVADIYVVNKADLPGADVVARSLQALAHQNASNWIRPILQTSSISHEGVPELADAIENHKRFLSSRRTASQPEIHRAVQTIISHAGRQMMRELELSVDPRRLEQLAADLVAGNIDPRQAAEEAVRLYLEAHLATTPRVW